MYKIDYEELLLFKEKRLLGITRKLVTSSGRFYNKKSGSNYYEIFLSKASCPVVNVLLDPEEIRENIDGISKICKVDTAQKVIDTLYLFEILLTVLDFNSSIDHFVNSRSKYFCFNSITNCPYLNMKRSNILKKILFNDLLYFHPCSESFSDKFFFENGFIYYLSDRIDIINFCEDYFKYIKKINLILHT